jgi:predicted CXXCH cytochrome family protein
MFRRNGALVLLCFTLLLGHASAPEVQAQAVLSADDCAKCHERQPAEIMAKGAAHKTQINCRDCHESHRPAVAKNIPQCNLCHSGTKHYELKDCMSCHDPHQPLEVTLKGELKGACLTCHDGIGKELDTNKSKHTVMACNSCHAQKHGVIPECLECHQSHSPQMKQTDCKTCHQAHQPMTLTYSNKTASVLCAACHDGAFNLLAASQTKHRAVACVDCHQSKHKNTPQCSACHGNPHPEAMHKKFPNCGTCHNTAHDLNNWAEKKEEKAKAAAPAKPAAPKPAAPASPAR